MRNYYDNRLCRLELVAEANREVLLDSNLAVQVEHLEVPVEAIPSRWQPSRRPEVSMPNSSSSTTRGRRPPEDNLEGTKAIRTGEDIRDSKVDSLASSRVARDRTRTNQAYANCAYHSRMLNSPDDD